MELPLQTPPNGSNILLQRSDIPAHTPQAVPVQPPQPLEEPSAPPAESSETPASRSFALQTLSWTQFHGFFPLSLLVVAIVGAVRYFSLQYPVVFLLSTAGLVLGAFLAHMLFAEESLVRGYLGKALKDPELAASENSLLRHGLVVFLLPVLSLFALTSTRNPIGLGFIWGVMMVYSYDLFSFARHRSQEYVEEYFHAFDVDASVQQGVAIGFVVFTLLFGVLLMASRLLVV